MPLLLSFACGFCIFESGQGARRHYLVDNVDIIGINAVV
jgi:hypothetical protein